MSYEHILTEIDDRFVGHITLNRPDQLNTFNTQLAEDLYQALKALDNDPSVRVILLKGSGKAFCAGIDVNELAGKSAMEYRAWIEHMERPLVTMSQLKKPVIAQLQGVAVANGMGVIAAADLAIAADDHVVVAPDRQDGCTPELLHVLLRTDRADDCTPSVWGQSG